VLPVSVAGPAAARGSYRFLLLLGAAPTEVFWSLASVSLETGRAATIVRSTNLDDAPYAAGLLAVPVPRQHVTAPGVYVLRATLTFEDRSRQTIPVHFSGQP
jgi:hypothetical protein